MKAINNKTDKRSAFWKGFASVFDFSFTTPISPTPTPKTRTHKQALEEDAANLLSDWECVGGSIFEAAARSGK